MMVLMPFATACRHMFRETDQEKGPSSMWGRMWQWMSIIFFTPVNLVNRSTGLPVYQSTSQPVFRSGKIQNLVNRLPSWPVGQSRKMQKTRVTRCELRNKIQNQSAGRR